jgi:hypothetical protein
MWKWAWDCDGIVAREGSSRRQKYFQAMMLAFRGRGGGSVDGMWMWMLIQKRRALFFFFKFAD